MRYYQAAVHRRYSNKEACRGITAGMVPCSLAPSDPEYIAQTTFWLSDSSIFGIWPHEAQGRISGKLQVTPLQERFVRRVK